MSSDPSYTQYTSGGDTYRYDGLGRFERLSNTGRGWIPCGPPRSGPPSVLPEGPSYLRSVATAPAPVRPARQLTRRELDQQAARNWGSIVGRKLDGTTETLKRDMMLPYGDNMEFIRDKGFNTDSVWSSFSQKGEKKFANHFIRVRDRQRDALLADPPSQYPTTQVSVDDASVDVEVARSRRGNRVLSLTGSYALTLGTESRLGRWTKEYDWKTGKAEPDSDEED